MASSRPLLVLTSLFLAAPVLAIGVDREGITIDGAPAAVTFAAPALAAPGTPCGGLNYLADNYFDPALMGGPLVGFDWTPTTSGTARRLEVFTGELSAPSFLAIWSDNGGAPGQPLAALGVTGSFMVSPPNTWYGADLLTPVAFTAGTKYWIVWDPTGGEQVSATDAATDVQPTYWGSFDGDVNGGAAWFGPFSFPDRRWKVRLFCGPPDDDHDGIANDDDRCPDTVLPEESPTIDLGVNRWADVDGDGVFDTTPSNGVGPQVTFTLEDTGGCSCQQIIDALGIGEGHEKYGCSLGIMRRWVAGLSP